MEKGVQNITSKHQILKATNFEKILQVLVSPPSRQKVPENSNGKYFSKMKVEIINFLIEVDKNQPSKNEKKKYPKNKKESIF